MHFEPNAAWNWHYDDDRKRVVINLINGSEKYSLVTKYDLSSFYDCDRPAMDDVNFNVDDASLFYTIVQKVQDLPYSNIEKIILALHAVTANRFHRKAMRGLSGLKNYSLLKRTPYIGEVLSIQDTSSSEPGDVLVLGVSGNFSLCIVLATGLKVNDRFYNFHDIVVVAQEDFIPLFKMNDGLSEDLFYKKDTNFANTSSCS